MVYPRGEIVFAGDLFTSERIGSCISGDRSIRRRVELQERQDLRIDIHLTADQLTRASIGRRHHVNIGDIQRLSQTLIVAENKSRVLTDRASRAASELVALKWRNPRAVEVIPGVEGAVPNELVCRAMERIRAGSCYSIDDAA